MLEFIESEKICVKYLRDKTGNAEEGQRKTVVSELKSCPLGLPRLWSLRTSDGPVCRKVEEECD